MSSTSVYGQTDGQEVDEEADTVPRESSGQVVLEAERILRTRCPESIILHGTLPESTGPGGCCAKQALREGKPIVASPDRWLNLIHVDDGVQAILAAEARARLGRIYNVADDQPVARIDFFEKLAELIQAPRPRFERPVGDQLPPHEQAHRRVSNRRMKSELAVELAYPSYREGLAVSVVKDG